MCSSIQYFTVTCKELDIQHHVTSTNLSTPPHITQVLYQVCIYLKHFTLPSLSVFHACFEEEKIKLMIITFPDNAVDNAKDEKKRRGERKGSGKIIKNYLCVKRDKEEEPPQ